MNIQDFSRANLLEALSNAYTSAEVIATKQHFTYLFAYLDQGGLGARKIVIEDNYISKDFLHDYSSYYALCFEQYPKICKRVHFFSNDFIQHEIEDAIVNSNSDAYDAFWENYLGFIVIKPIATTVIGFTILKTFNNGAAAGDRNFWGVRDYSIHFFGKVLKLNSLAFQEQDSVVSACATTAIWSMLNKASVDYHTILKSPSLITKDADKMSLDGSRLFPNRGLSCHQICQAINNSGLVTELKQGKDSFDGVNAIKNLYLKKIINAYSPIGIPIILLIRVPFGGMHGYHAITVSGHAQTVPVHVNPKPSISWIAENVSKFYAHDDQFGPFARINFRNDMEILTPWSDIHATIVTNIVIPVYPKVRISYEEIESLTLGLDGILSMYFGGKIISDLVWDIKIMYSEEFKKSIPISPLTSVEKLDHLTKSLPKYVWVSSCYIAEIKAFDFVFDATNVNNAMIFQDVVCYIEADDKDLLLEFLNLNIGTLPNFIQHVQKNAYYDFLINNL